MEEAHVIVGWLNHQLNLRGGFGTTKASIIAYQAVAEYWKTVQDLEYHVNVDVIMPDRSQPEKFNFNTQSNYITRIKFRGINKDVKVIATGNEEVILKILSIDYSVPEKKESECELFNLTLQILPDCCNYASMSVLNIGIPAGYLVDRNDLESLSNGDNQIFHKFEKYAVWPEIEPVIIYMKTVSDTQAEKISFKIQQMLAHHALQPAAVSVYDFHNKKRCVKFYHPEREKGVLFILSQNNKRICAEENCSKQIKGKMSTDDRFTKSCESTPTSKIEYVYKVAVENFSEISPTDIYTMRILQIIKEGYNVVSPPGTLRSFLSHQRCKSSLDLKTNQTYLIMGKSPDASMDNYSQQFIMDENTWVEYWPTMKECQTERYRPTCIRAWRNSKT